MTVLLEPARLMMAAVIATFVSASAAGTLFGLLLFSVTSRLSLPCCW
jgi:hypothetical protein